MVWQRLVKDEPEITVIDFETTGSVAGFPVEPWQIGFVAMRHGKVDISSAEESWLRVDKGRPFNRLAPGRHAQIRDVLAESPTLQELWPQYSQRLAGVPLCAHNIGTERTMLRKTAPLHKFGPWIDTLKIVRQAYPNMESKALEDVTAALGLDARIQELCPRQAHDALYDAVACGVLLEHMLMLPGWGDALSVE